MVVSVLAGDRDGAGYMENLRVLLDGGVGLVRLNSRPVNWWVDDQAERRLRQSGAVGWSAPDDPAVDWIDAGVVPWITVAPILGQAVTDAAGFPALAISNAPGGIIIARAGELLTLFSPVGSSVGASARVMRTTRTDDEGAAIVRLMTPLAGQGRVNIGTFESAVFELSSMSEPVQPTEGNWSYSLSFSEVFEDEVPGGFVEVDPWR